MSSARMPHPISRLSLKNHARPMLSWSAPSNPFPTSPTVTRCYQASEGYTDSGRYPSPVRYLNPQRSKSLQDRKGWIEGWEPGIKADEFIHDLGIGEAYLRHNGRPAKVKLIRADINPPGDFDLSEDLPRFSEGNEPPLNLTEKVNRVVMDRMRAAKTESAKDDTKN